MAGRDTVEDGPGCVGPGLAALALLAGAAAVIEIAGWWPALTAAVPPAVDGIGRVVARMESARVAGLPLCLPAVAAGGAVLAALAFGRYRGKFWFVTAVAAAVLGLLFVAAVGGARRLLGVAG